MKKNVDASISSVMASSQIRLSPFQIIFDYYETDENLTQNVPTDSSRQEKDGYSDLSWGDTSITNVASGLKDFGKHWIQAMSLFVVTSKPRNSSKLI